MSDIPSIDPTTVPAPTTSPLANVITKANTGIDLAKIVTIKKPASTTTNKTMFSNIQSWWNGESTTTKVAIAGGAVLGLGLLVYAFSGSGGGYTPNRRRRR